MKCDKKVRDVPITHVASFLTRLLDTVLDMREERIQGSLPYQWVSA